MLRLYAAHRPSRRERKPQLSLDVECAESESFDTFFVAVCYDATCSGSLATFRSQRGGQAFYPSPLPPPTCSTLALDASTIGCWPGNAVTLRLIRSSCTHILQLCKMGS